LTQTLTNTFTPSTTATPTTTASPNVTITVNLTIDPGNTGYTQIYTPSGGGYVVNKTLNSTGTTTVSIPTGNKFYVAVYQLTRAFDYQVSEIIYRINGTPDAASPYIQTVLGFQNPLESVATYGGDGHPTVTYGNNYVVDTYIGNPR
jgi:hypothetical protein